MAIVTHLPPTSTIGTLGPKYSFHDILRRKHYTKTEVIYYSDFTSIFEALVNNHIQYAIVALSNSIHGAVAENSEQISESGLTIIEKHELSISLHLAAKRKINQADITKVYAHPVAMNESMTYFKNLEIKHIISTSNSQALLDLETEQDEYATAISGRMAIDHSQMVLIKDNIHDREPNITTFALIVKK